MQMPWFLRLGKLPRPSHSLGDAPDLMRKIPGPEVGAHLKPIWGLDPEGEIQGVWRDVGIPHVWYMMGKISLFSWNRTTNPPLTQGTLQCADSSRHVALRELLQFFFSYAHECLCRC